MFKKKRGLVSFGIVFWIGPREMCAVVVLRVMGNEWDGGSERSRRKDLRLGVQCLGSDVVAFLEVAVTLLFEG